MKKIVIGILAHVDAGKTTLSEALLYTSGMIKKLGRVDHRNTFLDTHEIERDRGITIFSKQAVITDENTKITILDTPGHVDFSAETERTLAVLDYAVLVISASEGVQAHTETLWLLLRRLNIPTFVFVTKMDMGVVNKAEILTDLTSHLSPSIVDFTDPDGLDERIALCDEEVFEQFMDTGKVDTDDIIRLTASTDLYPCFFGSGLKLDGIADLLNALKKYTVAPSPSPGFGAKVYKIAHDKSGGRLTYMKITGGTLGVRSSIQYENKNSMDENSLIEEKITAIRVYSGTKFESVDSVECGDICAVSGLSSTYAGQALGEEIAIYEPYLEPVLNYRIKLPIDVDSRTMLQKLKKLEEEEPLLHLVWNERFGEIHAQLMGSVQTEILERIILERFDTPVSFEDGRIMYKETIDALTEGVGHFEPLRHYAEVHLLIEPLPRGSGLVFDTVCDENFLERHWQRLVLTHLEEKQHKGVLTGSPLTDVKITLVSGKAHLKHTEGGDFREATYRAVRHGLMCALQKQKCSLLEPYFEFRLEIPGECVGQAISDILAASGTFDQHEADMGSSVLCGQAPVATMSDYASKVAAYTHGKGRFSSRVCGYFPCHNAGEVIESFGYLPENDMDNTPDSVFCSHGAGTVIPWDQVKEYMHLSSVIPTSDEPIAPTPQIIRQNVNIDEKELEAIMEREFGPIKRRVYSAPKNSVTPDVKTKAYKKSLYIIDGYNVIFAFEELAAIAEVDLEDARRHLCDILANYHSFTKRDIVVVFDAYNVKGAVERKYDHHGVNVVFTKEGELGDTYIERLTHEIGRDFSVRVVTSDALIQLQAVRSGVLRLSAREFREEILNVDKEISDILKNLNKK